MCHFLTFFPIFATQINPQKMKTRHLLTIAVLISAFFSANAQRIDTIKVHSASMERDVDNIVVTPEQYNDGYAFPVVYLRRRRWPEGSPGPGAGPRFAARGSARPR